ncbi:transcriptional regulator [Cupriavidus necator]|jgi:transcriptional regulator with XRE-family HTH domain|uniref:Transcriptional regulator n=1 Tax=Cupriavidus necator TaxID=106590 RepID=A0A367P6U2_CUPNE|nr:helix-turn-helix transcriptional regulator [Cupriavidus necator]QQX87457.1 transcriptional regulator [Cupriavidus necator]RCJ03551.1 transcriptional regulator [Cupriavidus necator]
MTSLRQTFAQNLRKYRELRGYTQDALAAVIEVDRTAVSRIERLAPNLTLEKVISLGQALDVHPSQLLTSASSEEHQSIRRYSGVKDVSATVRALRTDMKLSQRQLGDKVGLDRNHVSRIETGEANLALDTLERVIKALGADITKVLG